MQDDQHHGQTGIIEAAAPNGQLPALPLNCSSISEPIMKFLAPPKKIGRQEGAERRHEHQDAAGDDARP